MTSGNIDQFLRPHEPPSSLRPVTECVLQLPPVTGNQQWGYVLEEPRLVGYVAVPLSLFSLVPAPRALTNATPVRGGFDYTGLCAQWISHCVVYQPFGHATARLRECCATERAFPLKAGCVYYLPSEIFARGPAQLCACYHRISQSSVDGPQSSDPPVSPAKKKGPNPRVSEQVAVGSVLIARPRTRLRLGGRDFCVDAG